MRLWLTFGAAAGAASWAASRYYLSTSTTASSKMVLAPVLAISHGGGPLPLLGSPDHKELSASMRTRVPRILSLQDPAKRPRAIVLVTAHWSTAGPTISSGARHDLFYDYYGFPPESYQIKYPAAGEPSVAEEVASAFRAEGLSGVELDPKRGWDHGVFVPMKLVNPDANVPIVQISVLESEDPSLHLRMGRALRALRATNIAIVGSGFPSLHNFALMGPMMRGGMADAKTRGMVSSFNGALTEALTGPDPWGSLRAWRDLPEANNMHPRGGGEHFMPLIVSAGAAEEGEVPRYYKDDFLGLDMYTFYWGGEDAE